MIDRYFAVNPQQINPLNVPHNRFVPTTSRAADGRFLRDVNVPVSCRMHCDGVEGEYAWRVSEA